MRQKTYKIQVLARFDSELTEVVRYIALNLQNPEAADNLVDSVESAIRKRARYPFTHKKFTREYYRIIVGNFYIFYKIENDTMIIGGMLYNRRRFDNINF